MLMSCVPPDWRDCLKIPVYEVFALRYGTRAAMSASHFPGGDPLVIQKYPAYAKSTKGLVVRLDVKPGTY